MALHLLSFGSRPVQQVHCLPLMRFTVIASLLAGLVSCGDSDSAADGILPGEPGISNRDGAGNGPEKVLDKMEDKVRDVLDGQIEELEDLIAEKAEELAGVLGQLGDFAPKDLLSKKGVRSQAGFDHAEG